jgi:glycosyltransferase involved in cell wall biosynthesis
MFDSEAFPKGYGEENDFCMRAASKGWRHLLDDSTFIFHKNAASFKNAKEELIKTNRATLDKRYPHYTKMVRDFICSEELKKCISDAEFAFNRIDENIDSEGAKILYILPRLNAKGGTPQTNADLMHGLRCLYNTQTFLLISDGLMINLFKVDDNGNIPLESHVISELILPSIHESHEYDMVLLDWCLKYSFDLIHYRHLAYHSFSVLPQLDKLGIKLIHSFHDFYAICPTVKLLDCDQKYCAGFCGNSHAKSDCKVDVWKKNDIKLLKNNFIYTWNAKITKYLQFFDAYITTSIFAKQLICNALPVVNKKPFYVIPHGREFQSFRKPVELTSAPDVLQVLVPGSITLAKGGKLLCKLARRLEGNVQFHMLGKASKDLNMPECVVCYGEYERDQFVNIVSKLSPQMHIGAIFSIWPETYSHTLSELWASGLPVLGFDYGAISERIRETGAGWVCDKNDIDSVIKTLKTIKNNNIMVNFANSQVLRWQHGDGKIRNLEWMAHQYCSVYSSLVAISKK